MKLPVCPLHETQIVDHFPIRCPLQQPNIFSALAQIQDESYREDNQLIYLGQGRGGSATRAVYETCYACSTVLIADSHIKTLRKKCVQPGQTEARALAWQHEQRVETPTVNRPKSTVPWHGSEVRRPTTDAQPTERRVRRKR